MNINLTVLRPGITYPHFDDVDKNQLVFYADLENVNEVILMTNTTTKVRTGVIFEVEEGYYPLITATGNLKSRGIRAGVLYDETTKELIFMLHNSSSAAVILENNSKVANALIIPVITENNASMNIRDAFN